MKLPKPQSGGYDFRRDLVRRHKLVPHLEKYFSKEVEHFQFEYEAKPQDDAWHPSGHCLAKASDLWAMARTNLAHAEKGERHDTQDFSSSLIKTFLVGHFWHALIQKAVVDLGFATPDAIERRGTRGWGEQVPERKIEWGTTTYKPYHWATGSGDVAPLVLPSGDEYVLDIKTMASHQYKGNSLPEWAAGKYEAQIQMYMDWFEVERGMILCVNKDSPHDMKEYEFVRNEELIEAIYEKWEFLAECIATGEKPNAQDDDYFDLNEFVKGPVAQ